MTTQISATEANRTFSNILSHVYYRGESFEITRGNKSIAKIVPIAERNDGISADELNSLCAKLPKLDQDDMDDFAQTVELVRSTAKTEKTLWE